MAFPGSTDLGAAKSVYDEQQDYRPNDTNLAEGTVCVFDNTSGDNRCVVLPNHANALLAGRAVAGIYAETAAPNLTQDTSVAVQRGGIAKCALTDSTACTRGGIAAYDPSAATQVGKVLPYTSMRQVPIGEFVQTMSSGTSQFVGVALWKNDSRGLGGLIAKVVGPSAAVTNKNNIETAYNLTISIPANYLTTNSVLRISGYVRSVHAADNAHVISLYFAPSSGALTAGVKLAASPSVTPGNNDVCPFLIDFDVRTATGATAWGDIGFGAAGTGTERAQGSNGVLTIDPTVANSIGLTMLSAAGGSANDQTQLESLVVEILGN